MAKYDTSHAMYDDSACANSLHMPCMNGSIARKCTQWCFITKFKQEMLSYQIERKVETNVAGENDFQILINITRYLKIVKYCQTF